MAKTPKPNNPHFHPENYPYPYCREQHVWKPYDAAIDKRAKKGYRIRQCENCSMKIHTVIELDPVSDEYGRVLKRYYHQPNGYHIKGGIDWHDRALLVAMNFMAELQSPETES